MSEIFKNLNIENLEGEIWENVNGFEERYKISNMGRVKSLMDSNNNKREKILKQYLDKNGYLRLILSKNGKLKNFSVHRLVAEAFIQNSKNYCQVNHINEDKTDNRLDNLEFCDAKYNTNYGSCIQRRVASRDWKELAEKLTNGVRSKQVFQYDKDGHLIKIWKSVAECGRNGFQQGAVSQCCNNCFNRKGNNIYKGFIWSYEEIKKGED